MNKVKFVMILTVAIIAFFCFENKSVMANEQNEYNNITSTSIIYGQPLYMSQLILGDSSVKGVLSWENQGKILPVGVHKEKVFFRLEDGDIEKTVEVEVEVFPKRVYLVFEDKLQKQYDGTDSIKLPNYIIKGIIDKTVYASGILVGKLESSFVGKNVKVTLNGLELKGEGKENYYIDLLGYKATIHPKYIEKFGEIKNKIEFISNEYVPVNSVLYVNEMNSKSYKLKGYNINKIYELNVKSGNETIDVDGSVLVKLKVDETVIRNKKIKLYNYYDGKYERLGYEYKDGYVFYVCNGLGDLVIVEKNTNYIFLLSIFLIFICLMFVIIIRRNKVRNKIKKYKSLKRRKDYENYL